MSHEGNDQITDRIREGTDRVIETKGYWVTRKRTDTFTTVVFAESKEEALIKIKRCGFSPHDLRSTKTVVERVVDDTEYLTKENEAIIASKLLVKELRRLADSDDEGGIDA